MCWEWVSHHGMPRSEEACSTGSQFHTQGHCLSPTCVHIDPCSLELFTPCAQGWLGGLLGKGQKAIKLEGAQLPEECGNVAAAVRLQGHPSPHPRKGNESGGWLGRASWRGRVGWTSGEGRTQSGEEREVLRSKQQDPWRSPKASSQSSQRWRNEGMLVR